MAKFESEIPTDVLKDLDSRDANSGRMMADMVQAGAAVVIERVRGSIGASFSDARALLAGLRITRTYKTPSDGGVNAKVGFYGYHPTRKGKGGAPVALELIALAREFGTRSGEPPRPFFRKSFSKPLINAAMLKVQEGYGVKDE